MFDAHYNPPPPGFAFVQYHLSDGALSTSYGNYRASLYTIQYVPSVCFDGGSPLVGNYGYTYYNNLVTSRRSVPTDVTIEAGGELVSGTTYKIQARIGIEAGGVGKSMQVHMVYAHDHYVGAASQYRTCCREGVVLGTVSLEPGESKIMERNFTLPSYNQENIRMLVWAQQYTGGRAVYQACMMSWPFKPLEQRGDLNCDGKVDFDDIDPFVLALAGQSVYSTQYPNCRWLNGDINGDGTVNFDDIDPFVALLSG